MPQLPQPWNNSAAQASLAPVASSPEYYIPLWWYSGGVAQGLGITSVYVGKGSTSTFGTPDGRCDLHTLNSNWSATTKFAFEATILTTGTTYTATAQLYDATAGAIVSGGSVSTTTNTMTVVRSAQFTLVPGHTYRIYIVGNNSNFQPQITDASLIVFPQ